MIYTNRPKQHNTKYTVKLLSGPMAGSRALVDSAEDARAECFYQADACNICATWYPPKYGSAE